MLFWSSFTAQLDEAALTLIIQQIITDTGATSAKDMGKVIGQANKQLAGKAEGRVISEVVNDYWPANLT